MEKRRLSLFLQFLFNLNLREGLDDVSYLQVVVVDKRYTALKSCGDFLHIVFVAFQGINRSRMDDNTVTDHTTLVLAVDLALGNHTAGDSPDFGNLEYLLDFHLTGDNLLLHLVRGHIIAVASGHALNTALAKKIEAARSGAYQIES